MTEGKFGIGICFRDSLGSFVQAHTMIFPFVVTTAECEATAIKHALALALSNGFERVIFESDCQQVVNALCNDYLYANELGTLLSTCSSFLNSNANYNIAYVRRQANRVAHNLARASLFQSSSRESYHVPALAELITLAFVMKFKSEEADFLMESKNLQIDLEDEEFLSSAFPFD
ncbi:eukaryotic translation initiation factor 3 subunit c [Trifolium pratense]|uniref:Eukaryotic translation initiation factor 3 subunit c n=1 Tax=Trifolium pratense TaxID=57577 RepID=A0A2K3LPR2_TRIPR|nr:eukaryotic translation initiation factor 3 subunit c [Trifolium pratense]